MVRIWTVDLSKLECIVRHNPELIKAVAVETQTGLQLDTGQGRGAVNGGKAVKNGFLWLLDSL